MRKLLTIAAVLYTLALFGQKGEIYKSIKMDFKLPVAMANESFTRVVDGVSDISLSIQFPVYQTFSLGFGVKHNLFDLNEFNLPENIRGTVQFSSAYAKIGHEQFVTERIFYEASIKGGYSYIDVKSESCSINSGNDHHTTSGVLIEPQLSLYMISRGNLYFGLITSYSITLDEFQPDNLCLETFSGHAENFWQGNYGFFSIGFGFSVFLNKDSKFKN